MGYMLPNDKIMTYEPVQYYSGMKIGTCESDDYDSDDEDSTFGSFNPNLKTKDASYGKASTYMASNYMYFRNSSVGTPT